MVRRDSRSDRGLLGVPEEVFRLELQSWVRGPRGVPQVYPCVRETQRKDWGGPFLCERAVGSKGRDWT